MITYSYYLIILYYSEVKVDYCMLISYKYNSQMRWMMEYLGRAVIDIYTEKYEHNNKSIIVICEWPEISNKYSPLATYDPAYLSIPYSKNAGPSRTTEHQILYGTT